MSVSNCAKSIVRLGPSQSDIVCEIYLADWLTRIEKRVFHQVVITCAKFWNAYPTNEQMAEKAECSTKTVQRTINKLVKAGLIRRTTLFVFNEGKRTRRIQAVWSAIRCRLGVAQPIPKLRNVERKAKRLSQIPFDLSDYISEQDMECPYSDASLSLGGAVGASPPIKNNSSAPIVGDRLFMAGKDSNGTTETIGLLHNLLRRPRGSEGSLQQEPPNTERGDPRKGSPVHENRHGKRHASNSVES